MDHRPIAASRGTLRTPQQVIDLAAETTANSENKYERENDYPPWQRGRPTEKEGQRGGGRGRGGSNGRALLLGHGAGDQSDHENQQGDDLEHCDGVRGKGGYGEAGRGRAAGPEEIGGFEVLSLLEEEKKKRRRKKSSPPLRALSDPLSRAVTPFMLFEKREKEKARERNRHRQTFSCLGLKPKIQRDSGYCVLQRTFEESPREKERSLGSIHSFAQDRMCCCWWWW